MEPYGYRMIRFWILMLCQVPSVIVSLLVFIYVFKSGQMGSQHLHNHVIVVILIVYFLLTVIELPITEAFAYQGYSPVRSSEFCSFWIATNYGLFAIGSYLMAFASIERYLLIFHERFVRDRRWLVHYSPIVLCILYPILFYTCMLAVTPCENVYNYEVYLCGSSCYQFQLIEGTIDWVLNGVIPVILITIANIVLIVRVTLQKRSIQLANTWRKIRLMVIQLLSVSGIYAIVWIPFAIIALIQIYIDSTFCRDFARYVLNYTLYLCPLFSSFLSLTGMPVVRRKVFAFLHCLVYHGRQNPNRVQPNLITLKPLNKQTMDQHQHVSCIAKTRIPC